MACRVRPERGEGEVQQRRFGGGVGVVLLLVLAVALAAGPDDPPVLVAPDVHLALPAGEGAGSVLLNESFMRDDLVMRLLSGAVSPR
ncbi:hypothetical protein ABID95_004323 [Streptomyces atratus]|uniref:hypothetical protein n=1 Tax=Streptomyces sp. NPDC005498 TaxID=3364717 RepID=UPI00347D1A5D